MLPLPQSMFDVFALALPRGHGFGDRPPIEAYTSDDRLGCAVITRDDHNGTFGCLVMRPGVRKIYPPAIQKTASTSRLSHAGSGRSAIRSNNRPRTASRCRALSSKTRWRCCSAAAPLQQGDGPRNRLRGAGICQCGAREGRRHLANRPRATRKGAGELLARETILGEELPRSRPFEPQPRIAAVRG
jgi:hypothetical protein